VKQHQLDSDGTPYGYKYALVGMYWYGEEPTMYLDTDDLDTDIQVEVALESALKRQHPDLEVLDLGVIHDGIEPDFMWRVGTWGHAKEVIKHLAWRLFLATRKW
jgi:hypothetical protein